MNSYSDVEKKLWPKYRDEINHSRNVVDVKGVFTMQVADLLSEILGEKIYSEDIIFKPKEQCSYRFTDKLLKNDKFKIAFESSDLGAIIDRFVYSAHNRYIHLSKLPEKTNSKIKRH
jgi:hypothetical protein